MRYPKELLKGITPLLVMEVLRETERSGMDLLAALKEKTDGGIEIGEGTIYPLLYRLESKGWIEGVWERQEGRRSCRKYRLTRKGVLELKAQRETWKLFSRAVHFLTGGE